MFDFLKVAGLALLDRFNETFEPWKKFDRPGELKPGASSNPSQIKDFYLENLKKYLDRDTEIFRNTELDALGDACTWQGVYTAFCVLARSKGYDYRGAWHLARMVTKDGVLLRGAVPSGTPWFVMDTGNKQFIHDDGLMIRRDDASLDSLAGFCFGAAMALHMDRCPVELTAAIDRLATRMLQDGYRLKNMDGSNTKYGDCRPGLIQAPVRTLAAAVVARLGEQVGAVNRSTAKKLCDRYGREFARTESHLLWNHPWANDNLALMLTASALLLEKDFGDARKGMEILRDKAMLYGNSFAIYLAKFCGLGLSLDGLSVASKIMCEFTDSPAPNGKSSCTTTNEGYPSVMFHGQRVATQPVPVWRRPNTDFIWQRSPYSLEGTDGNNYPGLDYLVAYFLRENT
jgi:hypothetical protein